MRSIRLILAVVLVAIAIVLTVVSFKLSHPPLSDAALISQFHDARKREDLGAIEELSIQILNRRILAGTSQDEVRRLLGEKDSSRWYSADTSTNFFGLSPSNTGSLWQYSARNGFGDRGYLEIFMLKNKVKKGTFRRMSGDITVRYFVVEFE
jgi:hypothetical protein